jgi:hypothetical protein
VIIALFTGAAASAVEVPQTAYGHIAITDKVVAEELAEGLPLAEASKTHTGSVRTASASSPVKHSGYTEAAVREYFSDIPMMIEVAFCESTFRHTLADGSVLQGRVDPADTGVMQINKRYHLDAATAMNLNIENLYDNMAYARHLYERQGLQPWSASAPCWNRQVASL